MCDDKANVHGSSAKHNAPTRSSQSVRFCHTHTHTHPHTLSHTTYSLSHTHTRPSSAMIEQMLTEAVPNIMHQLDRHGALDSAAEAHLERLQSRCGMSDLIFFEWGFSVLFRKERPAQIGLSSKDVLSAKKKSRCSIACLL